MVFMKERERLQKKLEKNIMFQKYLYKVVENAEEFHEIREIIARYDTLTATHEVSHVRLKHASPLFHHQKCCISLAQISSVYATITETI